MSFAAPWALAGLAFAAVPILLHLLARREPPTVVFPATRYLAQAARQHQRRLQLQHLLLLLVRTLLIVALVLAAAGPSWPAGSVGTHAPTPLVLVVDNSLPAAPSGAACRCSISSSEPPRPRSPRRRPKTSSG
ncbi:MAG: BatA domain-containing protein [Gemmatimonadales bacterium]